MPHRPQSIVGRAVAWIVVALSVVLITDTHASACSEDYVERFSLDDFEEARIVAIGQTEVVARTGATWRWHRAGVVAFDEVWPLGDDVDLLATTVWTSNSGRNRGGECYFGYDVQPVGAMQGFHVVLDDGAVVPVSALSENPHAEVSATELTARYGPPIQVQPDGEAVAAALDPLVAERRLEYWLVRSIAVTVVLLVLAFSIGRFRTRLLAGLGRLRPS